MTTLSNPKSAGECTVDVQSRGDSVLVKCKGPLVFGQAAALKDGVRELLPKSKRVVIDLGEVDYMDSSGLGTVVRLFVSAKTYDCEMQLVNLAPQVRHMFGVTRILSLFEPCGEHNIRVS
jgi:anti-sigma B factor antagonist